MARFARVDATDTFFVEDVIDRESMDEINYRL